MEAISISRVEPGNATLLARVAPEVFNDRIDQRRLEHYLGSQATMLIVAMDGDLVVGQIKAAVHLHPDKPADLYVDEVAVTPSHRRRGLARALLDEAQRWARERGCVDVWLAANLENGSARALYDSFAESKAAILYFWDL